MKNLQQFHAALVGINIVYAVFIVLGVFLILLNPKPNPWFGVRVPWTMADREIWEKTQLFSGKLIILVGIVGALFNFFFKEKNFTVAFVFLIFCLLLICILSIGYSGKIYKDKYHTLTVQSHKE